MVAVSPAVPTTAARAAAEEALLDAAERLLADAGYAGITTRLRPARSRPQRSGSVAPGDHGARQGRPAAGGKDRHEAARALDRYIRVRSRHAQAHRPQLWLG
jgi:hypothetical protein